MAEDFLYLSNHSRHLSDDSRHLSDDSRHLSDDSRHSKGVPRHSKGVPRHSKGAARRSKDVPRYSKDSPRHLKNNILKFQISIYRAAYCTHQALSRHSSSMNILLKRIGGLPSLPSGHYHNSIINP